MPKKTQIVQNDAPILADDEVSDAELELKPSTKPSEPLPMETKAVKIKRPYTCTEEHKEVLRQRMVLANQRKQELTEERRHVKEEQINALEKKKQAKILEEAEKLKRKEATMMKQLEVKQLVPPPKPKQKKKVVVYISDSDDEPDDEEEEEEMVVKPKRKTVPRQAKQAAQSSQHQPVYQPVQWKIV
jgi:hypothetical protein